MLRSPNRCIRWLQALSREGTRVVGLKLSQADMNSISALFIPRLKGLKFKKIRASANYINQSSKMRSGPGITGLFIFARFLKFLRARRSEEDETIWNRTLAFGPLHFILFSSVPLNSVAPLHLLQLPDGAAFQYVLSRISIGDFFLCGALLYHLPPRDSSKNTHGPPAVFWVYAFMLGFVGFQFGHLFIEERNRYDLFEFFRILAVFLVLVLAYRAQLASLSDREFLFLTTLFALCTVLLPNAFGIDVFQYLNNYSGNAEVLAERLKGLSRNTNTFSLIIFCFLLYLLNRSYEHAPTKVELIGILILVTLAIATKGRHALLTVIVASFLNP